MYDRPPFEAAHNCICAYPDMPILDFYKGYFDTVYIVLHPFYKKDEHGKITQVVSWHEFIKLAGFTDINQLDVALRNSIGGLIKKWETPDDVQTLQRTCELYNLWIPSEGQFQEALKIEMLTSVQELGHHYLFVSDEFGYERKLDYIPTMIEGRDEVSLTWGGHNTWYTNHNEILYASHWDSHFTLICSDRKTVDSILAKHLFEGFFCDEHTEIYWSLHGK
jgi:hypothetical protein